MVEALSDRLGVRSWVVTEWAFSKIGITPDHFALAPCEQGRIGFEVGNSATGRGRQLLVNRHQCVDATSRAALQDAGQPLSGGFVDIHREIGQDENPVRLGDLPGVLVVFLDRLEFVSQILLNDLFHVLGEVGQPLFDVVRLGPDPAGDELFVEIHQVHECGEILA